MRMPAARQCRVRPTRRRRLALGLAAAALLAMAGLTGCGSLQNPVPGCGDPVRLAIVAQSVPQAAYIPCIRHLSPGWATAAFDPANGSTSFLLLSDRAPGTPVKVRLAGRCRIEGASPSTTPRAPGVITYTRLTSTSPRFAGSMYDVFPGGCVSYRFDFRLGPHIALKEQFQSAVGLYPRQQLRLILKKKLGVELNP